MIKNILFLDDERNLEDVYWQNYPHYKYLITVRSFATFEVALMQLHEKHEIYETLFSFDHDIQDIKNNVEYTGKHCMTRLIELIMDCQYDPYQINYVVHSKNPVGKANIDGLFQAYLNFYKQYQT